MSEKFFNLKNLEIEILLISNLKLFILYFFTS